MKILLTGGGTAGSVSPLLAIAQKIKKNNSNAEFLWVGAKNGLEKKMVADYSRAQLGDIKFKPIASGKLRRYFDIRNFFDIFKIKIGFFQSIFIILKFKPDIILSAGSFIAVPVIWAGWILGKKSLIHQQDARPGLANKLMAPFATKITVTFKESLKHFPKNKTVWAGNPVREEIFSGSIERAIKKFKLDNGVPTLLVMGGGTGSATINRIIAEAISQLTEFCQIMHLTGGKDGELGKTSVNKANNRGEGMINDKCQMINFNRYHQVNFLDIQEMADAYAVADVVVSRCGMSSLTELSALAKPTIFIPLGGTHQEDNAKIILEKKAGIIIWQKELAIDSFVKIVNNIILDKNKQLALSENISKILPENATDKVNQIVISVLKKETNSG